MNTGRLAQLVSVTKVSEIQCLSLFDLIGDILYDFDISLVLYDYGKKNILSKFEPFRSVKKSRYIWVFMQKPWDQKLKKKINGRRYILYG